jgi:hypothetical protein
MHFFLNHAAWTPLWLVQAAMTIWMLVDANRRGVESYWFWIIFIFQPLGPWAYFFVYKIKDFTGGAGSPRWLGNVFNRRPSLDEVRHRVERSPTAANRLELGERLVEAGEYDEALPHLQAMLAREPEHAETLAALAYCHREMGAPAEAVPLLQKLVARQPGWRDYAAYRALVRSCQAIKDPAAVAHGRELVRLAPTMEHRYLLAEQLLDADEPGEARKVLEQGLEDFRYLKGASRSRDRQWVGKAKQLLREI